MLTIGALDPSQERVLSDLLADRDDQPIQVVYGPPGTGKSHLIVNLLFELAVRGQKVLFVSQNAEALEVIEGMITQLEKDFGATSRDLSFRDFCWFLYQSGQRSVKFLQGRYERRQLASWNGAAAPATDIADHRPYRLTYTKLQREANLAVPADTPWGMDELAAANLRFVRRHRWPEAVKSLSPQRWRVVMAELENYDGDRENFGFWQRPTGPLSLVERTNLTLSWPPLQAAAMAVAKAGVAWPTDWSAQVVAATSLDIGSWIENLVALAAVNRRWQLDRLAQESAIEVWAWAQMLVKAHQELEDVPPIKLPAEAERELFYEWTQPDFPSDRAQLSAAGQTVDQLVAAGRKLLAQGVAADQDLTTVLAALLAQLEPDFSALVADYPDLADFDADQLTALGADLQTWQSWSAWRRGWSGATLPTLKTLFPRWPGRAVVNQLAARRQFLELVRDILLDTSLNISELNKIIEQNQTSGTALDPLAKVAKSARPSALNAVLQLVGRAPLVWSGLTVDQVLTKLQLWQEDFQVWASITAANTRLASQTPVAEWARVINGNIRNQSRCHKMAAALANLGYLGREWTDEAAARRAAADLLAFKGGLEHLLTILSTVKVNGPVAPQDLTAVAARLQTALAASLATGYFSDQFYQISPGESLQMWLEHVKALANFTDVRQFDQFVAHHQFIHRLKEHLGADYAENVDEFLNGDKVNFDDFVEKITTDLVTTAYRSLPAADRPVMESDYFAREAKRVRLARRRHWQAGLASLRTQTAEAVARLKVAGHWRLTRSPVERWRANGELIMAALPVVIATPKEVAKYLPAQPEMFDYVIFDEASQMLPGQALPSIWRGKRLVVVGDPHQMPPTSLAGWGATSSRDDETDELEPTGQSILELAIMSQTETAHYLQIHYRSQFQQLFEPSRRAIYEALGVQSIFEAHSSPTPITISDNLGSDEVANFDRLAKLLEVKLLEYGDKKAKGAKFCLLFLARSQAGGEWAFRRYLSEDRPGNRIFHQLLKDQDLLISTVTNCQGMEADHTVIYFRHYSRVPTTMWFFREQVGGYKRLNVAITRQRRSLTLLMADSRQQWQTAAERVLRSATAGPDGRRGAQLLQSLLASAVTVDDTYLAAQLNAPVEQLASPLTAAVVARLSEHYAVRVAAGEVKIWSPVGSLMGREQLGFQLDIGIYSTRRQAFVVGIEVDASVYHQNFSRAFSDVLRRQTLTSKGWRLYRFWSVNWLADPEGEWARLIQIIDEALAEEA